MLRHEGDQSVELVSEPRGGPGDICQRAAGTQRQRRHPAAPSQHRRPPSRQHIGSALCRIDVESTRRHHVRTRPRRHRCQRGDRRRPVRGRRRFRCPAAQDRGAHPHAGIEDPSTAHPQPDELAPLRERDAGGRRVAGRQRGFRLDQRHHASGSHGLGPHEKKQPRRYPHSPTRRRRIAGGPAAAMPRFAPCRPAAGSETADCPRRYPHRYPHRCPHRPPAAPRRRVGLVQPTRRRRAHARRRARSARRHVSNSTKPTPAARRPPRRRRCPSRARPPRTPPRSARPELTVPLPPPAGTPRCHRTDRARRARGGIRTRLTRAVPTGVRPAPRPRAGGRAERACRTRRPGACRSAPTPPHRSSPAPGTTRDPKRRKRRQRRSPPLRATPHRRRPVPNRRPSRRRSQAAGTRLVAPGAGQPRQPRSGRGPGGDRRRGPRCRRRAAGPSRAGCGRSAATENGSGRPRPLECPL